MGESESCSGQGCVGAFDYHLVLVTATTTSPFTLFLDA